MRADPLDFLGKTVIITGGAGGIGAALVRAFVQKRASVLFVDIDRSSGHALLEELRAYPGNPAFLEADVTKPDDAGRIADTALERYGRIDVLINNAGVSGGEKLLHETSEEEWQQVLDVDLTGPFLCCKYVLPHMRERRQGSVIHIASVCSLVATRLCAPYCAAKAGILGVARSIAYDYAPFNVRSNAICPTLCETPMLEDLFSGLDPQSAGEKRKEYESRHPMGRMAKPADVVGAALFLASPLSEFITGIALPVDGGYTAK